MSLKNKITVAVLLSGLVLGSSLTLAEKAENADNKGKPEVSQEEPKGNKKMGEERMPRMFEEQDKDGDGKVSLEEFKAHSEVIFAKKDKNSDGYITKDEMRHPKRFKKDKGQGKGPQGGDEAPMPPEGEKTEGAE